MTSEVVDLQTASILLDKSVNTLKSWFRMGCPVVKRGKQNAPWEIRLADVLAWREQWAVQKAIGDTSHLDIDEAKRRKTIAEASLAELELVRQSGDVIDIAEVAKAVGEEYAAVRARLLAMPSKLAPQLVGLKINEIRDRIESEIVECLDELAYDVGYSPDDSQGAEPEAAAEADDLAMGREEPPPLA